MNKFLFLLLGLTLIPFISEAKATHLDYLNDPGLDDTFWWMEWDTQDVDSHPWGDLEPNTFPVSSAINVYLANEDSIFQGLDRDGRYFVMKKIPSAILDNDLNPNTIQWIADYYCNASFCSAEVTISVMDGDWVSRINDPDMFPADATTECFQQTSSPLFNSDFMEFPPGSYGEITSPNAGDGLCVGSIGDAYCYRDNAADTTSKVMSCSVTDFHRDNNITMGDGWVTILIWFDDNGAGSGRAVDLRFESFTITNTIYGDLVWNFPIGNTQMVEYDDFDGWDHRLLNGTNQDYGYFFSFDQDIPDPPTNLYTVDNANSITLHWTAPVFTGYEDLVGYKIERESPIGGGWSVLVANTGNLFTTYTDSSADPNLAEYNYRVRALNLQGESLVSNESHTGIPGVGGGSGSGGSDPDVDLTPDVDCTGDLTNFTVYATSIGSNQVTLCWNGVILDQHDLTGYQINYTTPWGIPNAEVIATSTANTTTQIVPSLQPQTQYSFRVGSISDLSGDVSTLTLNDSKSISANSTDVRGLELKTNGYNVYITDSVDDKIYQYNSTFWDITSMVYDNELDVVTNSNEPTGICFQPTGGEYYVTSNVDDDVDRYIVSTSWNVTSGTYSSSLSLSGEGNQPEDCYMRTTGTTFYTLDGGTGDKITQWTLSEAFNVTTGVTNGSFDVSTQTSEPTALDFSSNGLVMYILDATNDEVEEYDLSTAWDITTATHYQSKSLSGTDTGIFGMYHRDDDSKMFFAGSQNDSLYEFDFNTSSFYLNQTNIINVTTTSGDFDIGSFDFDEGDNPQTFDWHWSQESLNDDDLSVMVNYPTGINATCSFDFEFASKNVTHSNLVTSPFDDNRVMANFTFFNSTNDIVTINCIDENSNSTSMYIVTQEGDFPLFQQIQNFRNGTYGTQGMFGVFDFFTLAVVIFSMVGFNRVNPAVGGVFAIMIIGVATYFGFITNIITGATTALLVVIVTLMMIVHHRGDVSN